MNDVLSLVLGGGRGTRLYPLTMVRSKPAVPIAGKYRLIDIPISNCLNSGLNRVFVLTQFLSVSLHRHIANTYKFDMFSKGFVEVLAAQQTNEASDWYQGTADAVRQNMRYVHEDGASRVLVLSGDQLYRMDFRKLLASHAETGADVSLAVLPVNSAQTPACGIVRVHEDGRVVDFVEKPQDDKAREGLAMSPSWFEKQGIHTEDRVYLASMGIYLFNRQVLIDVLNHWPNAADFGKEIFPRSINTHKVHVHLFDGYWEDVGTIKSYHEASLALASDNPPFEFHSPEGVIYTRMRFLPASRFSGATIRQGLVSDGCIVLPGTTIERCVLGVRSRVGRNCTLRDAVIVGADRFETDADRAANEEHDVPSLTVGDDTVIENAILDKDCRIGRGVKISNRRGVQDEEGTNYVIRDGIVVIPKGIVVPDGSVI